MRRKVNRGGKRGIEIIAQEDQKVHAFKGRERVGERQNYDPVKVSGDELE